MPLTTTATVETFDIVSQCLSMKDPILVTLPPNHDNILYQLHPKANLNELTDDLCSEFVAKCTEFPKTVIFVHQYSDCSDLFLMLRHKLGSAFTEPPCHPDVSQFRTTEMYNRVLTSEKREQVLSSFTKADSKLRLVIATTTFVLGIDCPDICRIMHWGIPTNLEEYVQESGRAGCDGVDSKGKGGRHSSQKMKEYASNKTVCRCCFLLGFLKYSVKDVKVL